MRSWIKLVLGCVVVIMLFGSTAKVEARGLFKNSVNVANGFYAAEGFGTNYMLALRYNHYYQKWRYFIETGVSFSSIKSQVLEDLAAFTVFSDNGLFTYDFLLGYDMKPLGSVPYFVGGVAAVNQGGQTKFSGVIGVGKHIPLAQFFKVKKLGVRYEIRDYIFRQQINNADAFTAHNLSFTLALQYYF